MSTHTPAPWSAELYRDGAYDVCAEKSFGGCLVLASRSRHMSRSDEMHANARLIAAAPELLEALKTLVQIPRDDRGSLIVDDEDMANASAVIAKATGIE